MKPEAFSTELYMTAQVDTIRERIDAYTQGPTFLEFGGKPFGDYHASRVLPGYEADCKADMLRQLGLMAKVVMVVNARDILPEPTGRYPRGRIRGDSSLRYDEETLRLITQSESMGIPIHAVVLSVTPRDMMEHDHALIHAFEERLQGMDIKLHRQYAIPGYPDPAVLSDMEDTFGRNDTVAEPGRHLVVFSPGGGSGKFGVILSEAYHAIVNGHPVPNYLKFETFPVFALPADHALNLAYLSATADLGNVTVQLADGSTTYDKDIQNFPLLQTLYQYLLPQTYHPVADWRTPIDMSVNVIQKGIVSPEGVIHACAQEVARRHQRYVREFSHGDESETTVRRSMTIAQRFHTIYPDTLSGVAMESLIRCDE